MKPNILLITLDAVRPDRLRLYGGPVEMPNLEALAARGVTFTNAWAQAPNTWTSHASVFSGLWPHHHGLLDMDCKLDPAVPTIAEIFRDAGYATAGWPACVAAGAKFGLDRGFDYFPEEYLFGLGEWGAGFVDFEKNIQKFAAFKRAMENGLECFLDSCLYPEYENEKIPCSDDCHGFNDKGSAPWLAWLHYFDVHHMPPKVCEKKTLPVELINKYWILGCSKREQNYNAKVAHADHYLGKLLDLVDLSNTIVVVFSDHGEDLSLERRPYPCHERCSDEELRVVLVGSFGRFESLKEQRITKRVRLIDVAPTLLGMCGTNVFPDPWGDEESEHMDGRDFCEADLAPRMMIAIDNNRETRASAHRYGRAREDDKVKKQLAGLGYIEGDNDA